jgi:hypothetical protein
MNWSFVSFCGGYASEALGDMPMSLEFGRGYCVASVGRDRLRYHQITDGMHEESDIPQNLQAHRMRRLERVPHRLPLLSHASGRDAS